MKIKTAIKNAILLLIFLVSNFYGLAQADSLKTGLPNEEVIENTSLVTKKGNSFNFIGGFFLGLDFTALGGNDMIGGGIGAQPRINILEVNDGFSIDLSSKITYGYVPQSGMYGYLETFGISGFSNMNFGLGATRRSAVGFGAFIGCGFGNWDYWLHLEGKKSNTGNRADGIILRAGVRIDFGPDIFVSWLLNNKVKSANVIAITFSLPIIQYY